MNKNLQTEERICLNRVEPLSRRRRPWVRFPMRPEPSFDWDKLFVDRTDEIMFDRFMGNLVGDHRHGIALTRR